jgi:chemotaxis protein histidine kinase CheA
MSDDGMIDEFKVEAAELFENAENSLLKIDKGEDFLSNYNNIFRSFHSLKGAAGMFGLLAVQEHMHKLESLFEAQKKVAKMNNKQVDYFLSGIDIAKRLLDGDEGANFYHIEIADFNKEDQDLTATTTPATAAAPALKPKVKLERKKGIIFIVSETKESAEAISKIFETNNYTPVIYNTTKEALDVFESINPDVVFGGIETIQAVKDLGTEVPSIFISESITQAKIKEAIEHGAYTFVPKPYEAIPVLAICGNAISKHKTMELLEKSVNYILYQFTDLDTYLKAQGKEGIRTALKKDLQYILEQRKALSNFSTLGE